MRTTDTHVYFWGSFLSNFWWAPFWLVIGVRECEFKTSEHAFMAYKALYFGDEAAFEAILEAPDGKSAKAVGRTVKNFDPNAWSLVSKEFMFSAVYNKFATNESLRQQLLDTGNRVLVEASPLDTIWGVGLHETDDLILDEANWKGTNWLGEVLMKARELLRDSDATSPEI